MQTPLRLTRIDPLIAEDHSYLRPEDDVFFLREYTSGAGYAHSETNGLISNLKKSVLKRERTEYQYKEKAIAQVARELSQALNPAFISAATWVPMPPSRHRNDPEHDDRMMRILRAMQPPASDIRELLVLSQNVVTAHTADVRPSPGELAACMSVERLLLAPTPSLLVVVDDVLTTGAHFRAASAVLSGVVPSARVLGICIARRIFPTDP